MELFQLGDFTLSSGAKAKWKIECDALDQTDWDALAEMIASIVGPFSSVEGVPRGGLLLAECLGSRMVGTGRHLIVDDVLTTGSSMERLRKFHPDAIGAVVFARGPCPSWIKALFQMPEELWIKEK